MKQHYFDVPFAFAGDVTAIPDPLQVGGTVSMTEGWNNNYQRNLSTDPAALPIDRSTTNWLLLQISTAIQALQQASVPEFILASQNGGTAYSYGKGASVLWSASGDAPFVKYVSLTAGNTNTPSAADPQGLTTGWQTVVDPISTAAQASAGTDDASIMTPLKVAQQTALRALLAGSSSQVFNVGPATATTHAPQAQQIQGQALTAFTAAGTAPAYTLTTVPATAIAANQRWRVKFAANGTTGSNTLNVNGAGAVSLKQYSSSGALVPAQIISGMLVDVEYDGTQFIVYDPVGQSSLLKTSIYYRTGGGAVNLITINNGVVSAPTTTGAGSHVPLPNTALCHVKGQGAGGAGGGSNGVGSGLVSIGVPGAGGGYFEGWYTPATQTIGIGIGGAPGTAGGAPGGNGGVGGNTTYGAVATANGGSGGQAGVVAGATPVAVTGGSQGGTATGGNVVNITGGASTYGIAAAVAAVVTGNGGSSMFGGGAPGVAANHAGIAATNYGAGGGPSCSADTGSSNLQGGRGMDGIMIIEEWS